MQPNDPERFLERWFADARTSPARALVRDKLWFESPPAFDHALARDCRGLYERAWRGELDAWRASQRGALALILLFDQLPRNLFRRTARAYASDARALELTLELIEGERTTEFHPLEALFVYMPLQHAECKHMQSRSLTLNERLAASVTSEWRRLFSDYLRYARIHADIIERFGRFPHRNRALGRRSSAEERAYLEAGAETFGQG
ncbi:DUF924 family protein [Haliangium ochraceum]|uniref:Transmembrane protein n=1 Tax=Haliangium ochraceum (strain DSM 14365 / JCM 11303 / SMP-2) TaxID=502025 RepID=D0LTF1_HALO1|nr:DUF924 family protein [Haliangium ochraceum]ACY13846.1 protein of unknown function DUF924 [Haliangium ochraceum DSM 14365]